MPVIVYRTSKSVEALALFSAARETQQTDLLKENTKASESVYVELNTFDQLTSISAVVCYLFKEKYSDYAEWLDWIALEFRPLTEHFLAASFALGKVDQKMLTKLRPCLQKLDKALAEQFLSKRDQPGSIDVICWSLLLPCMDKASPAYVGSDFANVSRWCGQLSQRKAFSTSVADVLGNKDQWKIYKGLISRLKLPPLPDSEKDLQQQQQKQKAPSAVANPRGEAAAEAERFLEVAVTAEQRAAAKDVFLCGADGASALPKLEHPILPKEGARNLLVTSALPYVNNVPHLGNIIGSVLSADVFVRYARRRRGLNPLYVCGTDEYGTATETKAMAEGMTPRQICDKYHALHAAVYKWFDISFDYFGRTSTEKHAVIARDIFKRLYDRDCITQDDMEQLFCGKCEKFLADRFVEGTCPFCSYDDARGDQCDKCGKLINAVELKSPRCKTCGTKPTVQSSRHLFLDLQKLQPTLERYLEETITDDSLWTTNAVNITRTWLRDGLKSRCITRDLQWGVSVPMAGFESKVFYVWFDAPIGYISITANYTDQWEKWWKNPDQVELINFMAKDNVPFHSVIFPSCLIGADDNYSCVRHLVSAEYLNYEDSKFSKSRGIGVFGDDAKNTGIPADVWRFYLLYVRPETQDSVFSWRDMMWKNNSELLNNLGNFINRPLSFLTKFFDGVVPEMDLTEEDASLLAQVNVLLSSFNEDLTAARLRDGIPHILNISRLGNQYIQSNKPWVLVKQDVKAKRRAGTVTGLACNLACLLGALLHPYMPQTSAEVQRQCAAPDAAQVIPDSFAAFLKPGHRIGKPSPLFKKIEPETVEELLKRFSGHQK